MQGLELVLDRAAKTPADALGQRVAAHAMRLGLSCNVVQLPGMGGTFRICPPITVSVDEIREAMRILDQAIGLALQDM